VALVGPTAAARHLFRALVASRDPPPAGALWPTTCAGSAQERTAFAGLVPRPVIALCHEQSARNSPNVASTGRGRRSGAGLAQRPHLLRGTRSSRGGTRATFRWTTTARCGGSDAGHEPRVWLLDEPTRGADAVAKSWLTERLRAHARPGRGDRCHHDIETASASPRALLASTVEASSSTCLRASLRLGRAAPTQVRASSPARPAGRRGAV